jgi:hypothetical protein
LVWSFIGVSKQIVEFALITTFSETAYSAITSLSSSAFWRQSQGRLHHHTPCVIMRGLL